MGECALFKPPEDSPPFIGIVCSLTADKENKLTLGVNWLYRPTEVKLGKGILLEAAPNEVFYSFHRNAIPAASLLHPCKVAFLPKGVELPPGIAAFVCRRVYDIETSRLWWLTDKNYLNVSCGQIYLPSPDSLSILLVPNLFWAIYLLNIFPSGATGRDTSAFTEDTD